MQPALSRDEGSNSKAKPRLLIVEDESIVAADIAVSVRQLGYNVAAIAASGEEALVLAEQVGPNLVLMDIHLRGRMDGVEAAQVMRDRFQLPVVFLTAYGEDETFQRAKEAQPFGYILKPFEDRELRIVIEMALYKHQAEAAMRQKFTELERFNKVTVDRELRMIELKQEINALLQAAGKPERYKIVHET
jgi:CheY-like chemotaxis protein